VDDDFDAFHRATHARAVTHIADEIAHRPVLRFRKALRHFGLLELIAAKYHQALDVRIKPQHGFYEGLTERTGAACNEYRFMVEHGVIRWFLGN
jgi:hypothetical protein